MRNWQRIKIISLLILFLVIAGLEISCSPSKVNLSPTDTSTTDRRAAQLKADYAQLESLLTAQKWKEADLKTYDIMLKVTAREDKGYLDPFNDMANFPCSDLKKIDQLWLQKSGGHFGFSVQKKIWSKLGGKTDEETEEKLTDMLGWRVRSYSDLTFALSAPVGHLPRRLFWSPQDQLWGGGGFFWPFMIRTVTCKL